MAIHGVGVSVGFTLNQAKSLFFDRAATVRAIGKNTTYALAGIGGFIMKYARYSIKDGKYQSAPGQPPHTRGAKLLKRFLLFFVDTSSRSVVIGPVKIKGAYDKHTKPDRGNSIPELLEYGGGFQRLQVKRIFHGTNIEAIGWVAEILKNRGHLMNSDYKFTPDHDAWAGGLSASTSVATHGTGVVESGPGLIPYRPQHAPYTGTAELWTDVETRADWFRAMKRPTRWVHRNMPARPFMTPAVDNPKTKAHVEKLLLQLWSKAAA